MASLLAASSQDLAAADGLHARTETVRFGAAAFARLKCALWQSNPPISYVRRHTNITRAAQAALAAKSELLSLLAHSGGVKEGAGGAVVGRRVNLGKKAHKLLSPEFFHRSAIA